MDAPLIEIDARGHRCPTPTLRLRRGLADADAGALIAMIADDPMVRVDVPHFVRQAGHEIIAIDEVDPGVRFLIRKAAAAR